MNRYFFTYGYYAPTQPFRGGWTEVFADNREKAIEAYSAYHPKINGTIVPCCFIYTEEEFSKTSMPLNGNHGKYCVERISLVRDVYEQEREVTDGEDILSD